MAYRQGKKYMASITLDGKKHRKTFSEKKYALLWEQEKRREFELGILGIQKKSYVEINFIIDNFFRDYSLIVRKSSVKAERDRAKTITAYCKNNSIFCASELGKDFWSGYIQWRKICGVKNSTINSCLSLLMRIFDYASEREIIIRNPFVNCKKVKTDKQGPPQFFTIEEVKAIEKEIRDHQKHKNFYPLFFTAVRTGLRSSELSFLEEGDVSIDHCRIVLPPEKTKARETRIVPINKDVCEVLKKNIEKNKKNNYVFFTRDFTKFSRFYISASFRKAIAHCEDVGVVGDCSEKVFHSLRKTYISNMVMAGVEPQKIMRVVGHKNWAAMKPYLHLSPNYGNDIIDKIPY